MDAMKTEFVSQNESARRLYNVSNYVILSKLGSYGRVYLAKNKQDKTLYAIKKLKIEDRIPASTLREISLLKILQHPNIVSLHQVLISDEKIHMVLEYLRCSLDVFIKENDIVNLGFTSKSMYRICNYEMLWQELYIRYNHSTSPTSVADLAETFGWRRLLFTNNSSTDIKDAKQSPSRPNSRWRPKMAAPIFNQIATIMHVTTICLWAPDGLCISIVSTEHFGNRACFMPRTGNKGIYVIFCLDINKLNLINLIRAFESVRDFWGGV